MKSNFFKEDLDSSKSLNSKILYKNLQYLKSMQKPPVLLHTSIKSLNYEDEPYKISIEKNSK